MTKREQGKTGDEVVEDIVEGMASAYDPEPEAKPKKRKAPPVSPAEQRKEKAKLPKTRGREEWRSDFWASRENDRLHDVLRAHVHNMLDLAGMIVRSGKDSVEFKRELRELIEKRFVNKETK